MRLAFAACCLLLGAISTSASAASRAQFQQGLRLCERNVTPLNAGLRRVLLNRAAITAQARLLTSLRTGVRRIDRNCAFLDGNRDDPLQSRLQRRIDEILRANPRRINRAWADLTEIDRLSGTPVGERVRPPGPTGSASPVASSILYLDLGYPWRGNGDLPDSNQFVIHRGNIGGGFGGSLSFPGTSGFFERGFWWAIGFYFTYIHSSPTEVGNRAAPGSLLLSGGHSDMTAGFVTGGFRMRPFEGWLSPIELMILGGLGLAYNSTRQFGPGGAQVLFSEYTALAWMGRVAAKYWINDYVALGLFAAYLGAQQGTATLAGGGAVSYGGPSIWLVGLTLAIALH